MNEAACAALVQRAEETHSDALVVRHNGHVIGEWRFGSERDPIQTMSCTKSVVSLAVGALIDDGAISSLDQPVHEFYPEWRQGAKQRITIRHLLNHTSGLQNVFNTEAEIYPSPDVIRLALAAELSDEPGTYFSYNNKAVNLLAGVVERAAGERMDRYLQNRIFAPLGIAEFDWTLDPAGTPYAMAGLALRAADLAKIGQLVLDCGVWNGVRLISEGWVDASFAPGQPHVDRCGLLWWRVPAYERFVIDDERFADLEVAGVDATFLDALRPLANITFDTRPAYQHALGEVLGPEWAVRIVDEIERRGLLLSKRTAGEIVAYESNGWLGQYLVVYPAAGIVAVRLIRDSPAYNADTDGFPDFVQQVLSLR
ncbi:MAG: serine hydrolase domain-containing protein [Dehalococcoidia bacterium]